MKLNSLVVPLGFLLSSLPSCLSSKSSGLLVSTHQQRWLLPSASPLSSPLNPTSVNFSAKTHHRNDMLVIRSIEFNRSGMASRKNLAAKEDLNIGGQEVQVKGRHVYVGNSGMPLVEAIGLMVWLGLLFYLLGTTASNYFSCTLEKLSEVLGLSPAVAGATLLAIGNGAPDVFSCVLAFASSDTEDIGFGDVLGGTLFITTIVSGIVALITAKGSMEPRFVIFRRDEAIRDAHADDISVGANNGACGVNVEDGLLPDPTPPTAMDAQQGLVQVDAICFTRDVIFLLLAVGALTLVLLDGEVKLQEAITFLCIYPVYAIVVWTVEMMESRHRTPSSPLRDHLLVKARMDNSLQEHPDYHVHSQELEAEIERRWDDPNNHSSLRHWLHMLYKYCIEWPLMIPQQLTIPVVEEKRWSRKLAIASCTFAPVFVAAIWTLNYANHVESRLVALGIGEGLGVLLGLFAYFYTNDARPPQRSLTLWLAGGFFMSIAWFYLVANELVKSLESLGKLFNIDSAILALTVLAWGNCVGDLVADLSLASHGPHGVKIAISGCYAGPLFNIVVGLGLSMVVGCLKSEQDLLSITDKDGTLFYIIGFLGIGLVWVLVILPLQGMRLGRSFGIGLIVLYCSFIVVVICYTMGLLT